MIRRELHDLELESLSVDYNWSAGALWRKRTRDRTCGTVASRILVRDSTNYIKNNIKDINQIIRILLVMLLYLVAIIVIPLKNIHPISDLKIILLSIVIVIHKAIDDDDHL